MGTVEYLIYRAELIYNRLRRELYLKDCKRKGICPSCGLDEHTGLYCGEYVITDDILRRANDTRR